MSSRLERVVEPELMDATDQATAYAEADFSDTDERFVAELLARFGDAVQGPVIDLGCGPGNMAQRLADALPGCRVLGVDGSEAMLTHARAKSEGRDGLFYERHVLPTQELPASAFRTVVSNSLLHHLHDPDVLWQTVARVAQPGAVVWIADLRRPETEEELDRLVTRYAADAPDVLRRDFRASLCAAFRVPEVVDQLARAGLSGLSVEEPGDRHLWIGGTIPAQ